MKIYEIRGNGKPRKYKTFQAASDDLREGEEIYEVELDLGRDRSLCQFKAIKPLRECRMN